MELYYKKLKQVMKDDEQFAAFKSNISTIVKAGPGSGKTTVLTLKMMRLLNEKIKEPRGLGCITYSKEASREFIKRLKDMGYQKRENVIMGTVHSFCISQIITPFAHLFNDDFNFPISIISDKEKYKLFQSILNHLDIDRSDVRMEDMENYRSHSIKGYSKVEVETNKLAAIVASKYEEQLKEMGKTDFTEIIKYSTLLINREEYVRKCLEAKFPWILVDEYQDFGKPLHEMILSIVNLTNIKLFAVGDPDQSIYSFNGALPGYFFELYDDQRIMSIDLKTNYRSNQDIIDASSIAMNIDDRGYRAGTRFGEKANFNFIRCDSELKDQFNYVTDVIIPECKEKGVPLDEISILVKDNSITKALSEKLEQMKIPFYFSKFEFSRSDIVLWLKDCATWMNGDKTSSFSDISNFWIQLLESHIGLMNDQDRIKEKKKLFLNLLSSKNKADCLSEWLDFTSKQLNLECILKDSLKFPEELSYLEKLVQAGLHGDYKNFGLKEFSQIGKPKNQVAISTRHSSKGLEFEVVIMLGLEQGVFPDYRNEKNPIKLSEERRVFFVCVTRAKRDCYLLMSNKYERDTRYGRRTFLQSPSEFWIDLYNACKNKSFSFSTK
jgi:DNA helicase II / ATP-dependent DNA helicase PcrA